MNSTVDGYVTLVVESLQKGMVAATSMVHYHSFTGPARVLCMQDGLKDDLKVALMSTVLDEANDSDELAEHSIGFFSDIVEMLRPLEKPEALVEWIHDMLFFKKATVQSEILKFLRKWVFWARADAATSCSNQLKESTVIAFLLDTIQPSIREMLDQRMRRCRSGIAAFLLGSEVLHDRYGQWIKPKDQRQLERWLHSAGIRGQAAVDQEARIIYKLQGYDRMARAFRNGAQELNMDIESLMRVEGSDEDETEVEWRDLEQDEVSDLTEGALSEEDLLISEAEEKISNA
ncbi:hypothetical protein ANO11243_052790 [Dothideomycetidae sp. 11243]|nr:hypothetical protein ANO11243_052790 [fungal sp. No.11243]